MCLVPYIRADSLTTIPIDVKNIKRYVKRKNEYYNYPVAFDIETSSFRDENDEPRANMYIWQMCFGDSEFIVYGRTWEEWLRFIRLIRKVFHLKKDRILVIYVHNLAYEFQFIRKLFTWQKVFATDKRAPLYARTNFGIEFRCSYRLSGYSLSTLAKNLIKHDLRKLDTLDYKKIRHSHTPITPEEMEYNIMDVRIVCAYIQECIDREGNITKLPLTKTGYVRNNCKLACYGEDHESNKYYRYREQMQRLTMEVDEYLLMRCAFAGGFTHANSWYVRQVIHGVTSVDFTSSYPYVMFGYKYPWSKGELCYPSLEYVLKYINTYGWILDLELYGVESKILQDDYISYSKCVSCEGYVLNNGRVNCANYIHIVVTSIDLEILMKTYRFNGGIKIIKAYKYYMKYLPTDFINELVRYYDKKTTLKGVEGKEEEYLNDGKEPLNSLYGMSVTSPVRPEIDYTEDEWEEIPTNIYKGIDKYNKNPNRFLPYIVGVFVTAYARRNLWEGILECGADYIYSDTDSIKLTNYESHKDYFESYNKKVVSRLKEACSYHNIPFDKVSPKTIKGIEKTLGVWDFDGYYTRFKTLGAKRYMVEYENGDISLTVSGLNKYKSIPYLMEQYGSEGIFEAFKDDEFNIDNMTIPEGYSGRMVSTYIDNETSGEIIDYLGNKGTYHELSSVNLEESTYTLSLSKDYMEFLIGRRKEV